ncbi:MAG TPA: energy transducer TonB [Pyrinomonadaceae bacterium]|nr:energy transducer TonB [Pyrinomonadaceae bacterium]
MFTNLIESDSHRQEFKRRSSFFLATVAAYALILSAAGVASIYAYDAHLEAQNNDLVLLDWVPPITTAAPAVRPREAPPIHRSAPSNAPVDHNVTESVRTAAVAQTNDPTRVPPNVGTTASAVPPVTGPFHLGNRNVDPPTIGANNSGDCVTCTGTTPVVRVEETPPTPPPVVKPPTTTRLPSSVLISKAVSLPQPPYPSLAKQIKLSGAVSVQILVDESGKVVAAHAVNGHPLLTRSAEEAAQRARFTPTILSGVAVKVQGVITYNFVLQ